jgi:hypothetical protein
MLGHLFIPHVNKRNGTSMNIAEVKPVKNKTYPNTGEKHKWAWSISICNNISKAGTENTFVYTICKNQTIPRKASN